MKTTNTLFRLAAGVLIPALLLLTVGCSTVDQGGAQAFATGVAAAKAQTQTAFDAVVDLTRDGAIEYAVTQDHLTEEALVVVPNAEAVAAWNGALDPIESYAKHLSSLSAPDSAQGVETSLGGLAKQFNATSDSLKSANLGSAGQIAPGVASAFAEAASALTRIHAQKQAMEVAAQADPEIRKVLTALADAIGKDNTTPGLRSTVRANWEQRIGALKADYLRAGSPDSRRPIVKDFIDLLKKRDAQDELLAALRRSYLALAEAHTALAKGRATDLGSAIDIVAAELKRARDLQDQFTKTLSK
jgi:hypothetical protein